MCANRLKHRHRWPQQQDQVIKMPSHFNTVESNLLCSTIAARKPTYGELIDLFKETEREYPNNGELLCAKFKTLYPKISTAFL